LEAYLALSTDKISSVKMEFVHSIVNMKTYLEYDAKLNLDLMDTLNKLKNDENRDVVEAVEQCDFELL
jgi:hypothetical protein